MMDRRADDRDARCDVELLGCITEFWKEEKGEEECGDDVDCDG